jgi:DnaJ-class molecular chaperone
MAKQIRCNCGGKPFCKLCLGKGKYDYDPGPRGYIPFQCPTCAGKQTLADEDGTPPYPCPTCKAQGVVDPAHPPPAGMFDVLMKILFGA